MIDKIFIKEKLKQKKPVVGVWNTIPSPSVTEIIASAGVDFVIIDFEHGPFNSADLSNYYNSCVVHNVSPITRVPIIEEWLIQQSLDQGAHGLIHPHVKDAADIERITNFTKYPPLGKRGFTPFSKATSFNDKKFPSYPEYANTNLLNIALVEDLEGLNNIDLISKDKSIDVVYFGSYDISSCLGVPGETRNKKVLDKVFTAAGIAKSNGKFVGGFLATDSEDANWLIQQGLNFIVYQVDSSILRTNIAKFCDQVKR